MHTERYRVPPAARSNRLDTFRHRATRGHAHRALVPPESSPSARPACGTQLESAATRGELDGRTDIFIHAGYEWQVVDVLMTNFHLPKTTLLMMIHAFVGDRWRRLYEHALSDGYRFLSFGDAMLLDRHA
jgi:S-adenosylmethionine:tRNA ribosyltransferase-isomerase